MRCAEAAPPTVAAPAPAIELAGRKIGKKVQPEAGESQAISTVICVFSFGEKSLAPRLCGTAQPPTITALWMQQACPERSRRRERETGEKFFKAFAAVPPLLPRGYMDSIQQEGKPYTHLGESNHHRIFVC